MSMPHYHSHTNYSKISILPFRSNMYLTNKQKKSTKRYVVQPKKKKKKKPQTLFIYLKGSSESTTCQVSIPPFPAKSFPPKRKPTTTLRDPPLSKLDFAPFPSKLQTHTHSCSPHFLPRERERCLVGTREACTTATKLTHGATAGAAPTTRRPPPAATPSSRS